MLITIGSYPLVPPYIYRGTASISFPIVNDSSWRSTVPHNLRLRNVRAFLSTLGSVFQFHSQANFCPSSEQVTMDWARSTEEYVFTTAQNENEYAKRVRRSLEENQKEFSSALKKMYAGQIRVRTLSELAYMKIWEGASEEVKEKASAPSDDPVRLLLLELYKEEVEEEATSELFANELKLFSNYK